MRNVRPTTIGAWAAIGTAACFLVGIPVMVASGVQVLIPSTGHDAIKWIHDVDTRAEPSSPAPGW